MYKGRLQKTGAFFFTLLFILLPITGPSEKAHGDEPKKTLPVTLSVDIHWEIDEGRNIRKGYFRMNANTTLNLDRTGSGLDHKPKLTPFSLKYRGRTFGGSCHFEETLTQKKPQPDICPPLLEEYSGSRGFSFAPPEQFDSINLSLRRFGVPKGLMPMGIPNAYYEFFAGGITGKIVVHGRKRKIVNGKCTYEKAEKEIGMNEIGLRFPIPEKGPMKGMRRWPVKLDGPPRNFSIKISEMGMKEKKRFRPASVATGGNATYFISWNLEEVAPDLRIKCLRDGQWADVTDETQTVVVGEQLHLKAFAVPGSNESQQGLWTIPGKTIKQFIVTREREQIAGKVIYLDDEDLKNPEVTFYWWDTSKKPLSVKYMATIQGEKMTAEAEFEVKEPSIKIKTEIPPGDWIVANTPVYDPKAQSLKDYVNLMYDPEDKSKDFSIRFSHDPLSPQFPGETQYVQIVKKLSQREESEYGCNEGEDSEGIDTNYPYAEGPVTTDRPGFPMPFDCLKKNEQGLCVNWNTNAAANFKHKYKTVMKFEMYLMFKPDKPQSIFVPLRMVDWNWIADCHRKDSNEPWNWKDSSVTATRDREAEKFPEWDHVSPEEVTLKPCKEIPPKKE
jgi:hypothetical protein